MRVADVLLVAAGTLRGQRKRTLLSLIGMSIGIAAMILLSGLGEGARGYLRGQFELMGTDVLAIVPGKVETSGGIPGVGGAPNDLTISDAKALERGVRAAERIAPIQMGNETIACGDRSRQMLVIGSTNEMLDIRKFSLRTGNFLPRGPWDRGARVVVLGHQAANELMPGENPLGAFVRIGGWRMRVIGVLASQGLRFGMNLDETAFIPVATAQAIFDRQSLFQIAVQVRPGFDIERAKERCAVLLEERHGEEDFTITTPDSMLSSLDAILAILTLGLAGIASISLAVAGIGIMNVMLVSVAERTEEIGLSKAIGAEPRQILALFLTEAAMLSGLGALLGLAIGYTLLRGASLLYPSFPFQAPAWAAGAAIAVSLVVGITFGLWPAARAVKLDPVAALAGRAR